MRDQVSLPYKTTDKIIVSYILRYLTLRGENKFRVTMAVFWVVTPCSLVEVYRRFRDAMIVLMMEAASNTETSVNFYQTTWRNNPEDSHPRTRRRENLKSHK
jgi:hypothetical protein